MEDWTFRQAVIFASQIVSRQKTPEDRLDLARQILTEAEPIAIACRFFYWIRKDDSEAGRTVMFSSEVECGLGVMLAERIKDAAASVALFKSAGRDTAMLLAIWTRYGSSDDVHQSLLDHLESDPGSTTEFLKAFLGRSWRSRSALPRPTEFNQQAYERVSEYISPTVVFAILRTQYGAELDDPQYHHPFETPSDIVVAHQFSYIHRSATLAKNLPG